MATKNEMLALQSLIAAAVAANASNDSVNIVVDVSRSGVDLRISPDKEVQNESWDWVFYAESQAYFSNEIWEEKTFLARCSVFLEEVNKCLVPRDADGVPV